MAETEPATGGLGVRVRYGYALGNFSKSLHNSTVDLLYLFYLIHYLRTPPELAGATLFAVTVADCVTGLALGHVIDQRGTDGLSYRKLKIGRAHV